MNNKLTKTLSFVFILTAIYKVLVFLRDSVFSNLYGLGYEATAYQAALKIPTQIVDIVLSSAIVSCFIPVFNELIQNKGKEEANKFARNFINIVSIIATFITIIGIIFSPQIVNFLTDFKADTYALTVDLIRITFPMIIFTAIAFSFVGLLQSYGQFYVPAFISGLSNLVVIVFLLLFSSQTGIRGVCYCTVFAWLLQVLVQLPFAKKYGYKFSLKTDFKDENIKKVLKLAIPILISTAVLPINNLISMKFASSISDASYSALEYAYKLYVVIYGIFSYAIGNIIFPELSKASSSKDNSEYIGTLKKSIKLVAFLLVPITLGLMIYSNSIVSISYERGEFDAQSTVLTSNALFYYAIGIIGAGLVEIMNKAFYAKQNTKTPLIVGLVIITLNIALSYLLSQSALSYLGIALATAIVALINGIILTILLNRENKIIDKDIGVYFGKVLLNGLVMSAVVIGINALTKNIFSNITFGSELLIKIIKLLIGTGAGAVVYFAGTYFTKTNVFLERK